MKTLQKEIQEAVKKEAKEEKRRKLEEVLARLKIDVEAHRIDAILDMFSGM